MSDSLRSARDDLHELADRTPPERVRHIDLLRAVAIGLVVLGHWLVIAVTEADEQLGGVNALRDLQWIHPLTWLFQVMPVFFFVGGYANAASWCSHRERGGDAATWVLDRYDRLVRPTTALLVVLTVAVVAAQVAGSDHDLVATGAWLATVPMWFLLAYLVIVALAPMAIALHERWGLVGPVALTATALVADIARFGLDVPLVGNVNYLVVWWCIHQIGFAWRDGRISTSPVAGWSLLIVGLAALVGSTRWGPYPISVVTAPGQAEQNTEPPTVAILALAAAQLGLALLTQRALRPWLHRRGPWTAVVAVNSVILTVFLWHMAAAIVAALVLYGTGLIPVVEIGTGTWFLLRLPWLTGCAVALAILVLVVSPVERSVRGSRSGGTIDDRLTRSMLWLSVGALMAGMLGVAMAGPGSHGPLGLPTVALGVYAAGAVGLELVRRRAPGRR